MQPVIDSVKEKVRKLPNDIKAAISKDYEYEGSSRFGSSWPLRRSVRVLRVHRVQRLRVRVVAFRGFSIEPRGLEVSEFFELDVPSDFARFELFLNGLDVNGFEDENSSALEALAVAMKSEWTDKGDVQRHIVVMFTDSSAPKIEERVGVVPEVFADEVPSSLVGLAEIWDGAQSEKLKRSTRRLLIFGPETYPWNIIGDTWGNTIWLPSQAGKDLKDFDYSEILSSIAMSD